MSEEGRKTNRAEELIPSTGACRQVLSEFGNFDVYCLRPNGKVSRTSLAELLPIAFSQRDLTKGQGKGEDADY